MTASLPCDVDIPEERAKQFLSAGELHVNVDLAWLDDAAGGGAHSQHSNVSTQRETISGDGSGGLAVGTPEPYTPLPQPSQPFEEGRENMGRAACMPIVSLSGGEGTRRVLPTKSPSSPSLSAVWVIPSGPLSTYPCAKKP